MNNDIYILSNPIVESYRGVQWLMMDESFIVWCCTFNCVVKLLILVLQRYFTCDENIVMLFWVNVCYRILRNELIKVKWF